MATPVTDAFTARLMVGIVGAALSPEWASIAPLAALAAGGAVHVSADLRGEQP